MLLVNGGGSKFFYDYVPLSAGTEGSNIWAYEFTTRDLGIPDGTTIEFIYGYYFDPSSYDENDIETYVSPLTFSYYYDTWEEGNTKVHDESLVFWVGEGAFDVNKTTLLYSSHTYSPDPYSWAKMRYSY